MKRQNKKHRILAPPKEAGEPYGGSDTATVRVSRQPTAQLSGTGGNSILRETQSKNPGPKGKRINQPELLNDERRRQLLTPIPEYPIHRSRRPTQNQLKAQERGQERGRLLGSLGAGGHSPGPLGPRCSLPSHRKGAKTEGRGRGARSRRPGAGYSPAGLCSLVWGWLRIRGQPRPTEPPGALLPSQSPRQGLLMHS